MCASCYRKNGKGQLTWNCPHSEKLNYSMGMCQTCYFLDYKKKRALKQKQKLEEEASAEKAKIDPTEKVNDIGNDNCVAEAESVIQRLD